MAQLLGALKKHTVVKSAELPSGMSKSGSNKSSSRRAHLE